MDGIFAPYSPGDVQKALEESPAVDKLESLVYLV